MKPARAKTPLKGRSATAPGRTKTLLKPKTAPHPKGSGGLGPAIAPARGKSATAPGRVRHIGAQKSKKSR